MKKVRMFFDPVAFTTIYSWKCLKCGQIHKIYRGEFRNQYIKKILKCRKCKKTFNWFWDYKYPLRKKSS